MSTKRKTYSAEFKAKVVLEVLEAELTLNQIASKYELLPANVKNWKKIFLENMSLAFDKSTVVKEYKEQIETLKKDKDSMAKKVGELTLEKDFLEGKLVSLVSSKTRKNFTDTKHKLSLNKQCKLLHIAKSTLYYSPIKRFSSEWEIKLLNALNEIHSDFPYYGTRRLVTALENEGYWYGGSIKYYWQVANSGREAEYANCLRDGIFDDGEISKGGKARTETTSYTGEHFVRCFAVQHGEMIAQSEPFLVKVA